MSGNVIEVRNLTRRYGYRVALRDITLDFSEKGIQGLFGSNGAGKTTLMRIISTLLRPHGGTISVMGYDPQEEPEKVKEHIGLVGDKILLYEELSGIENLRFYSKLYDLETDFFEAQVENLAPRFGIKAWLEEPVKNLSTGLKKRLDIVRSLIHNPDLLLLDEPFSGVDKDTTEVFSEYLDEQRNSRTTIVTTHNLVEADFCDRIAIMDEGRVIALDTPETLRKEFTQNSGEVFEIYPEKPINKTIFSSQQISISPFGRRYHIWGQGLNNNAIGELLASHEIPYRYIRKISPLMEDVFIYFLEKK